MSIGLTLLSGKSIFAYVDMKEGCMTDFWYRILDFLNQDGLGLGLIVFGLVFAILGLRTIHNKQITLSTTILGALNGWSRPTTESGKSAEFTGRVYLAFGLFFLIVGILITTGVILRQQDRNNTQKTMSYQRLFAPPPVTQTANRK